jgi:hypothetical protein
MKDRRPTMIEAPDRDTVSGWRTIRHFAYVDRAFRDVRRAVAAAPQRLLSEELRVRRAGFDLARDVRMILGDVEVGIHSARLPIRWEDATRPALFPILDATIEVAPVRAGRHAMTQLGLFGRYRPPFGRLGALADGVAGHGIVVHSVEGFLDDLVHRLEATVPVPAPEAPEPPGPQGSVDVQGRRRIVLGVTDLDHAAGGAAGLALRLLAVRGVLDATVSPTSELAVIDYDATVCRAADLLRALDADH